MILKIPTGTKSLLFGVHCFWLHPLFVALAWWKLYGFPNRKEYWVAFYVHDIGYWGCEKMDDEEGEFHPLAGAELMHKWFDDKQRNLDHHKWYDFCLFHSRFLAKKYNAQYSKLCVADKYASILYPWWLYKILGNLSGEIHEYVTGAGNGKYASETGIADTQREWWDEFKKYMAMWVVEYKDIKKDVHT